MANLKKNTFYLYILTASNYIFGIATLPYVTRILGPEEYGRLGFALAFGAYFTIIIDFGFILSATRQVTLARNEKESLSQILTSVTYAKIFLGTLLLIIIYLSSLFFSPIKDSLSLILLFLLLSIISGSIPDFLYRGLENMKIVTFRGVLVRGIATCLTFIFLKHPGQAYMVPLFQIIGSLVALFWISMDLYRNLHIKYIRPSFSKIAYHLKDSFPYFISRIASSIYGVTNTIILGFVFPKSNIIGFYSSAEKFKDLGSMACSPVADSFYPYMIREKNYKILFKTLILMELLILLACVIGYIWSEEICIIAFGKDFAPSGEILRWFIPIIAIILPIYMLGFPALSPINKTKWANYTVEIAMVNQLIWIIILFFTHNINAINLCRITILSEYICLFIRIIIIYRSRQQIKSL